MRRTVKSKLRGRKAIPVIGHVQALLARPAILYSGIMLVLLILSLSQTQISENFRTKTWLIFSPVINAISAPFIALTSFAGNIKGYQTLQADYKLLKAEHERLLEWYHTAQLLQAENQSLKSLLNVRSIPEQSFVTARVMSDVSTPYVRSVLLNVGEEDGVKEGQAVIADKGLIGRIVDMQSSISRVLLLADINSRIPVIVEGTSQRAIIAGRNHDAPQLEYIPEDIVLETGMKIVTSGDGEVFPPGVPIGVISAVKPNRIEIDLFAKQSDIEFVRILDVVER